MFTQKVAMANHMNLPSFMNVDRDKVAMTKIMYMEQKRVQNRKSLQNEIVVMKNAMCLS